LLFSPAETDPSLFGGEALNERRCDGKKDGGGESSNLGLFERNSRDFLLRLAKRREGNE
jgi:hypothetical protein